MTRYMHTVPDPVCKESKGGEDMGYSQGESIRSIRVIRGRITTNIKV